MGGKKATRTSAAPGESEGDSLVRYWSEAGGSKKTHHWRTKLQAASPSFTISDPIHNHFKPNILRMWFTVYLFNVADTKISP